MATNERLRRLRFPQRDTVRMSRRALMGTAECGVGFLLGAVLAGAEIFGLYAPFGVAAVTVGGGILGIGGMLLGVPLAASAYKLLGAAVGKRLEANS